MVVAEGVEEADEAHWPDRAHDAERQRRGFEAEEAPRDLLGIYGTTQDLVQVRSHETPEIGELYVTALPTEEAPAKLGLQLLDGACERRLCDMAPRRRLVEVQGFVCSEKISNLMHFHLAGPPDALRSSNR